MKIFSFHHKKCDFPANPGIQPLHVGAAHGNVVLGFPRDDTGDNISAKNPRYCELTGIYWVWKNANLTDNVGFCHYRRYFVNQDQLKKSALAWRPQKSTQAQAWKAVESMDYSAFDDKLTRCDAILLTPLDLGATVQFQYIYFHIPEEWKIMCQALREMYPDTAGAAAKVSSQNFLSPYNMFCMSADNFRAYCEWLFPLLALIESRLMVVEYPYHKRSIGVMAERLLNIYCQYKNMKIEYSQMVMLGI